MRKILFLLTMFLAPLCQADPYPFPVPFVAKKHTKVFFKDLPGPGSIKIFTASGDEVTQLSIAPGETLKSWDVTTSSGKKAASGVYFYLIIGADESNFSGKLIVIR
jgi:hypothetical protein